MNEQGYPQGGYPGYPQQQAYGGVPVYPPPQPGYPQGGYPGSSYAPGGVPPPQGGSQPDGGYGWKPYENPNPVGSPGAAPFIDPESLEPKNFSFDDQSIRKGFIRKVYLILMGQLMFTFAVVALFVFHRPTQEFAERNPSLLIISLFVTLGVVIAMACCEGARRTFPTNFICLGIFTLAESFMVGVVSSRYTPETVLLAVGITALLCLALTLFATQTKYDFTACGGILLCALVCLIIFGFVGIFFKSQLYHTIYACIGALLACIFLIYDTQMMMGGDHKYSISPEEYIFAALNLYMDVIRIFLYILQLLGEKK